MPRRIVSNVIEAAGLLAIATSIYGLAGEWWGLLSAGVAAVVYGAALEART